jgi:hypothetical protein
MVSCTLHLLLLLLLTLATATLGGLGLLSADTAGAAATEGRSQGEVDVLLGVETDHEGRNVDNLLADTDVALADEDTGVVDGLGKTELVDTGLETTLKEILDLQGKNVIELHARLVEDTDTHETANQGVSFEETLGVLLVEGEQLTVMAVRFPNCSRKRVFFWCSWTAFADTCKGEKSLPGSTTNLGQGELDTPDLTLVLQTILANELQLRVPTQ